MKYASVCSGVEAASLAWMPLGWEAAWFSEIEPFPCAVLKERFPNVPNLGDMTKIEGEKYRGTVDLLVGGTPCQGFSVAGKQGGLNDPRSALCLSYCRLLETMRPRWFVWENVPGVFSTNKGADFRAFLREIDAIGYSCAWRVLDAQYVRVDGFPRAVPQRRRRVFVVGHLGGDWRYPASVLFEPGCLPRDTPPRRVKGKGFTGNFTSGAGETGRLWDAGGVNPTLNQRNSVSGIIGASNQELLSQNANGIVISIASGQAGELGCVGEEVSQTLSRDNGGFSYIVAASSMGGQGAKAGIGGCNLPLVQQKLAVRRLLPLECERLMGFPDNWTRIPWRGKPEEQCPDSPRYKACGNSMCVNVMRWIGMRIEYVERKINIKAGAK